MYKLIVFAGLLAVTAAAPGFISPYAAPLAAPFYGHSVVSAPVVSAPYVKAAVPVATSYANTVKIASPIALAAPAPYVAAPAAVHAPIFASPFAHAW